MVYTITEWEELKTFLQANPKLLVELFSELNTIVRRDIDAQQQAERATAIAQIDTLLKRTFDNSLTIEDDIDRLTIYEEKHAACLGNIVLVEDELLKKLGANPVEVLAFRVNLENRLARWHKKFIRIRDDHRATKVRG